MNGAFFPAVDKIAYGGAQRGSGLFFRYYEAERLVLGRPMAEHLRAAVCYWHTFAWQGNDVFGGGTFARPWHAPGDPMERAQQKLGAAFEFIEKLGVPFFTFHDRDVAPEGENLQESNELLDRVAELVQEKMSATGIRLLWGTANCFSHPRYMNGAATNPDPEVFAYAAGQVKHAMDVTQRLGGENYVLWGGREGYESLLNTNMKREQENLGRFLNMVAEYKHKIGFHGLLLLEPKPKEPTKHQYDFDTAAVFAFLQKFGLEGQYKVNIEANHAILSGHSFQHEVEYALANDVFGSIDMNRGDSLLGWDTDQFPNDPIEVALVMKSIIEAGGFTSGGMNFDAKLRRASIEPEDIFHAHICGLDTLAQGLLIAEKMIQDGKLRGAIDECYAGWDGALGQQIHKGETLESLSARVLSEKIEPQRRSGRQEALESLVNSYLTVA